MLTAFFLMAVTADGGWELARDDGRNVIERRRQSDGLMELRASTTTDLAPATVATAFWNRRVASVKAIKKYEIISQTDVEKVLYQQVKMPIVKDRDWTVRITRYADPANELYQFFSRCDSSAGPAENDDHVRVMRCHSEVTIEGIEGGRTRVSYITFADPAGKIPHWIVNMLAPKAAAAFLDKLLEESRGFVAATP